MAPFLMLLLCIPAIFIFSLGVSVFIVNHPLVLRSRYIRIFSIICVLPVMLLPHSGEAHTPLPLFWLVLVVFSWRASSGYTIYGVASSGLREALIAALTKLNIPFSEDMTGITLTAHNAKLGTMLSGLGVCRLRTKSKAARPILDQVAKELRAYFKINKVKMKYTFNIAYTLLGIILLATFALSYTRMQNHPTSELSHSRNL